MKKFVSTWVGLKTINGRKGSHFSINYMGKCIKGWKDFYGDLKPWQKLGYSNPIFCISENTGYDRMLGRDRVVFCLLWHNIQW